MSVVEIVVPWHGMADVKANWPTLVEDYSRQIAQSMRNQLPTLINSMLGIYKTGKLALSAKAYVGLKDIRITIGEGVRSEDGFGYAPTVLVEGARPHSIDQRKLGRNWPMRWFHRGGAGVAWKVKHPGQPARLDIIQAIIELAYKVASEELLVFKLLEGGS